MSVKFLDEETTTSVRFLDEPSISEEPKKQKSTGFDVLDQAKVGIAKGILNTVDAASYLYQTFVERPAAYLESIAPLGTIGSGPEIKQQPLREAIKGTIEAMPKAETIPGSLVGGLTQFAVPAAGISKVMPIANNLLKTFVVSNVSLNAAFDPYEKRLSNIVAESVPEAAPLINKLMSSNKEDPELLARVKMAFENAGMGGLATGVVRAAELSAGWAIAKNSMRKAEAIKEDFQYATKTYQSLDLNPEEAQRRAAAHLKISDPTFNIIKDKYAADLTPEALKNLKGDSDVIASVIAKDMNMVDPTANVLQRVAFQTGQSTSKYLQVVKDRIMERSPTIGHFLNKNEMDLSLSVQDAVKQNKDTLDSIKSLSKQERAELKAASLTGDRRDVAEFMAERGGSTALSKTAKYLDGAYERMNAVSGEVGFSPFFMPRMVKDYKGLKLALTKEYGAESVTKFFSKAVSNPDDLTQEELGNVIDSFFRTKIPQTAKAGATSHMKGRTFSEVPEQFHKYYADPDEALAHYVHTMELNINRRGLLGYRGSKDVPEGLVLPSSSLGQLIAKETTEGRLTNGDFQELAGLIHTRFTAGEKAAPRWAAKIKSGIHASVLGQLGGSITQAGDTILGAYFNGLANQVHGLAKTLSGKSALTREDLGLEQAARDLIDPVGSHKMVQVAFKASGFNALDSLGKNTFINAALLKKQGQLKTTEGIRAFEKEYKDAFTPQEFAQVSQELKNGIVSDNVKYIAWNELSKAQPISLLEMPEAYLKVPAGRLLYALKSFTIKQLNTMYSDGIKQMKAGNTKQGAFNLMNYTTLLTASGMATGSIQDALRGRDITITDKMVDNLYKAAGTSDYVMSSLGQGKVADAALATILPPIYPLGTAVAEDIISGKELDKWKSMRYVPVFGWFADNYFGSGYERWKKQQQKEH